MMNNSSLILHKIRTLDVVASELNVSDSQPPYYTTEIVVTDETGGVFTICIFSDESLSLRGRK